MEFCAPWCYASCFDRRPVRRDNMEVFRMNGFDFKEDPASGRLLLSAVPFR